MASLRTSVALLCTVLLFWSSALVSYAHAAAIQYCDDKHEFCFAVTKQQNYTADSYDIFFTISATPSLNGGWTGIGFGREMEGALMFIIYEDQESKSLVASIRTTDSHSMPEVIEDTGDQIAVVEAAVRENEYLAQFVCYSCWAPDVEVEGLSPYIFAGNKNESFHDADEYTPIMYHDFQGVVWGNMSIADVADEETAENAIPSIQNKETVGFTTEAPDANKPEEGVFTRVRVHGTIMTVSFMGLYYAGSVAIRSPILRAFKYHWMIQTSASVLALANGLYMFLHSTHFGFHKILGLTVLCSLLIQIAAGYKHHIDFVKIRRQTIITLVHRWLGRGILLFGTLNVGLGMYYRHWSGTGIFVWFVIWCAEIAGYGYILLRHYRHNFSGHRGQRVPNEDSDEIADAEMFDIGDDFDNEDDEADAPLMEHQGKDEMK